MKDWGSKLGKTDNPFSAHAGKPLYSGGGSDDRYLGRVVIELWESDRTDRKGRDGKLRGRPGRR
jgi:hypothetical protein